MQVIYIAIQYQFNTSNKQFLYKQSINRVIFGGREYPEFDCFVLWTKVTHISIFSQHPAKKSNTFEHIHENKSCPGCLNDQHKYLTYGIWHWQHDKQSLAMHNTRFQYAQATSGYLSKQSYIYTNCTLSIVIFLIVWVY